MSSVATEPSSRGHRSLSTIFHLLHILLHIIYAVPDVPGIVILDPRGTQLPTCPIVVGSPLLDPFHRHSKHLGYFGFLEEMPVLFRLGHDSRMITFKRERVKRNC